MFPAKGVTVAPLLFVARFVQIWESVGQGTYGKVQGKLLEIETGTTGRDGVGGGLAPSVLPHRSGVRVSCETSAQGFLWTPLPSG